MVFTNLLILIILVGFLGFLTIYSVSPKKFELKIINNELIALLYSTYFFLPFTTKIKKYKNIKKAYVRKRVERSKYSKYFVYDLMLESSKRPLIIVKGKREYKKLEEHCEKINQSISSFAEYSFDICRGNWRTFIIIIMVIIPLFMMIPHTCAKDFNYSRDIVFQYFIYVYLSTIAIIAISIILSSMVNRSIESKNQTNVVLSAKNNIEKDVKEQNRDINSEAQRMYDSIIK